MALSYRVSTHEGCSFPVSQNVRVEPITEHDVEAVAELMRVNDPTARGASLDECISRIRPPWAQNAPNHGYRLVDGATTVGFYLALYSERTIEGRRERFCNLSRWLVLPEYRTHSIRLMRALLAQPGYHFIDLPDPHLVELDVRMGFQRLDAKAALIPNLLWPTRPGRVAVTCSPQRIEAALTGEHSKVYHDHLVSTGVSHMLIETRGKVCHVMYTRRIRVMNLPSAEILYVSDPELFRREVHSATRHLLVHHRILITKIELRVAGGTPRTIHLKRDYPHRSLLYKSPNLDPAHVDFLYGEFISL